MKIVPYLQNPDMTYAPARYASELHAKTVAEWVKQNTAKAVDLPHGYGAVPAGMRVFRVGEQQYFAVAD